jgi:hypothetical protein
MFKHFIIPTLGRINKQVTYNNLPQKYKDITSFVVQDHEYDEMNKLYPGKVLRLPVQINRIAPTREWIFNKFRTCRHFVFDDDLNFVVKEPNPNPGTKWLSRKFTEQDFDDAFALFNKWMDEGITYGGMQPATVMTNIKDKNQWPIRDCQRIMTNVFYDGPSIPTDLEWNRVAAAEDLDVNLQLLTRGFKNRVTSKYTVNPSVTSAAGGCSVWRTIEVHNEAQKKLAELWPDFVTLTEKNVEAGPWKGLTKYGTIIRGKKAYESSKNKLKPTSMLQSLLEY